MSRLCSIPVLNLIFFWFDILGHTLFLSLTELLIALLLRVITAL